MKRGLPKEPSTGGMILTAISGITLGILLGSFILLREAPLRGNKPAESGKIGDYVAYYSPGSVAAAESATVKSRISRLGRQIPGSIPFTEMEINHYLSQFKSADTSEDGTPSNMSFTSPNVRIETDRFVLSGKIIVNPQKDRFEVLMQAFGRIENGDNGVKVKVDKILLNSLRIPKFGGLVEKLFDSNKAMFPLPTEVKSSLGAIREVELLEDQIVLAL
jgi:hypothetical protein